MEARFPLTTVYPGLNGTTHKGAWPDNEPPVYPKADTPRCTTQACGVRDHHADYKQAGAVVLGISPDPVQRIAKFDDKYGLGFPLLADEDHAVAEAYDVWVEKSMYGRKYMGVERTTFVISPEGVVRKVFRRVKPGEHDAVVLGALAS